MSGFASLQADVWLRRLGALLVGLSLLVLAAAYAAMSWEHGTPLLWNVAVHEDGHRTLAGTLFYLEHATRELPLDLLLGAAIGAGAAEALSAPRRAAGRVRLVAAGLLGVCILLMTLGTALELGAGAVLDNLLQYHTREGEPLVWGAHWRYHLLERGPMVVLALGFWGIVGAFRPSDSGARGKRAGRRAGWIVLATFIALSALFTPDLPALSLPFTDARYLGHQVREIFTHGLVTLPLSIGLLLLLPREEWVFAAQPHRRLAGSILLVGIAFACFAYVLLAAIGADAASAGQSDSIITLLAPHFFEHGLTYLVTPLTALLVFAKLRPGMTRNVIAQENATVPVCNRLTRVDGGGG